MSEQNPYQTLGVTETTSFEEIQAAKEKLIQRFQGNPQAIAQLDRAYDAIIMDRLKLRQEGKIKVPETIRFPEKQGGASGVPKVNNFNQAPSWIQNLIDQPSQKDILLSIGIFSVLAITVLFAQTSSFLSLLLTVGMFVNIYLLNRKQGKFAKAFLISIVTLIFGTIVGAGIANFIPILAPEQLMAIITFILFSVGSIFFK